MKIKKLGLLCLTIVTALAVLGIGYSMWWSEIAVVGNVSTGSVNIVASNPDGTWAYKNLTDSSLVVSRAPQTGNVLLVGSATATISDDHDVVLNWTNLFPLGNPNTPTFTDWECSFDVTNTGTVPVHIDLNQDPDGSGWYSNDPDSGSLTTNGAGFTVFFGYRDATGAIQSLEGYQLEPNQTIHVVFVVQVNEDTAQGQSGQFWLHIDGGQWNEISWINGGEYWWTEPWST